MNTKANIAPVWIMGALAFSSVADRMISKAFHLFAGGFPDTMLLFLSLFWTLLFLAEAGIYWIIRKRIYRKSWMWVHLVCSIAGACFQRLFLPLALLSGGQSMFEGFYWKLTKINSNVVGALTLTGTIFFIATIVKSFSHQPVPANDNDATTTRTDSLPGKH